MTEESNYFIPLCMDLPPKYVSPFLSKWGSSTQIIMSEESNSNLPSFLNELKKYKEKEKKENEQKVPQDPLLKGGR